MKEKKLAEPESILAIADRKLFASVAAVQRVVWEKRHLTLFLVRKPKRDLTRWLTLAILIEDPVEEFKAGALIIGSAEVDGETYLLTGAMMGHAFSLATAMSLSKEATLTIRSPTRQRRLDFHALIRAQKKTTSQG